MSTSWLLRVVDARVQMQKMRETSMGFIDGASRGPGWLREARAGYRAFGAAPLRLTLSVVAALSALGVVLAAIRLIPLVIHPDVPPSVVMSFVRAALLSTAEMALLAAPVIGWAVAAASLSARGEARAFGAVGVGPGRLVRASWPGLVVVGAGMLVCALLWGETASAPGELGREVLMRARSECVSAARRGVPAARAVPLLDSSWVCLPGGAVTLVGPLPTDDGRAVVSARTLSPSDDLRTIILNDAVILAESKGDRRVILRLARAELSGLQPPLRSSPLAPWERALVLTPSAVLLGLWAGWLVLRRGLGAPTDAVSRIVAAVAGVLAAGLAIATWSWLERRGAPRIAFTAVPAVGAAVLAILLGRLPGASRGGSSTGVQQPREPRAR